MKTLSLAAWLIALVPAWAPAHAAANPWLEAAMDGQAAAPAGVSDAPGSPMPVPTGAPTVTLVASQMTQPILPDGTSEKPLMLVAITHDGATALRLTEIRLENATVGPGTPGQLDAEFALLSLWVDDGDGKINPATDMLLQRRPMVGREVRFSPLSYAIPTGAIARLIVGATASTAARDGDSLDVAIASGSKVVFDQNVAYANTFPVSPPGALVVDGMAAAQVAVVGATPSIATAGSQRVLAMDFRAPTNGYESDTLDAVRLVDLGDAQRMVDIEAVEIWRAGPDGIYDGGSGDDLLLGQAAWDGLAWSLGGLAQPATGSGRRIYVSVNLAPTAVDARRIELALPHPGLPALEMSSANDGPIDTLVSSARVVIIKADTTTRVAVSGASQNSATLLPGSPSVEVFRLGLINTSATAETLSQLILANRTAGPGAQADLDAEWTPVALSDSTGVLANATVSGGLMVFSGLMVELLPGKEVLLTVRGGASLAARDGDVLDLWVPDSSGIVLASGKGVSATWPIDPVGGFTIDGLAAAQITLDAVEVSSFATGSARNLALGFVLPANGYEADVLNRINVENVGGSALPGTDIETVEAWVDDGNDVFDPQTDRWIGTLTFTGNRWELTGLGEVVPRGGLHVYVSCDIGDFATEGATVRLSLPSLPDVAIGMNSDNDGPIDRAVEGPQAQTLTTFDRITLAASPAPAGVVRPGSMGVELLHLDLTNSYLVPKTLTALTVTNATIGSGTIGQLDGSLANVTLREDGNDDGVLGSTSIDPVIGTGSFSGGRLTFAGLDWALPAGQSRCLFVTADVTLTAADGDSLGAVVTQGADLFFSDPTAVAAAWPIGPSALRAIDGMVARQVVEFPTPAATIGPGEGPAVALDVVVPRNGYANDVLRGIELVNRGTAAAGDLAELRLWQDGGDGIYGGASSDDTDLGAMTYLAGQWTSPLLSVPLGPNGTRLFAAAIASGSPADSSTFRLAVPLQGITVDSGNDGPVDAVIENPNAILLSTASLLTSLEISPAVSVIGQTVTTQMILRNVGADTIQSITPSPLAQAGSGALSILSGPTPPTTDLTPGQADTIVWTLQAGAAGTVRLTANASGIASGLPRQSLASESNPHQIFVEAQSVDLFTIESMPFSVNRGQTGVVPFSLTFENPAGQSTSTARILSIRLDVHDEFGAGIVPADLFDRVVVREGPVVYLDKSTLETAGNRIDLTFAQPALVDAGGGSDQVTLNLALDISASTIVPAFRVSLADSTVFTADDATSGAPVTVLLQNASYPVESGLARIGGSAMQLDVTAVADSVRQMVRGQPAVPMLEVDAVNVDPSGFAADVRVARFDVQLMDSAGVPIPDPQRYLDRIRVRSPIQTFLDRPLGAADDTTITLVLSPFLSVQPNVPVRLSIEANAAADAPLESVWIALADTAEFDARDANSLAPVTVTYAPDPLSGAPRVILAPAESLRVARVSGIEPLVTIGQTDVPALGIRARHSGDSRQSSVRIDTLTVHVRDQALNPLVPAEYIDHVRVFASGAEVGVQDSPPATGSTFFIPLSGVVLTPGDSLDLSMTIDIEATAPASFLQLELRGSGVGAVDANTGAAVTVAPDAGETLPLGSGIVELHSPARELVVSFESLMPAVLAADGASIPFARTTLTNTAQAGAGDILLDHFILRAGDRSMTGIAAGAALVGIEAWVADTLWGQSGSLAPGDAVAFVQGEDTLRAAPGVPVGVELRMVTRPGTPEPSLRLGFGAADVGVIQPASALLSVSVIPAGGEAFPFWSEAGLFGGASLATSYSNFPNPFAAGREVTRFAFYLPADAQITLRIWTARGDRVRTLLDAAAMSSGLHQDQAWDGRNGVGAPVHNGLYVAEIVARFADGSVERHLRKVAVVR